MKIGSILLILFIIWIAIAKRLGIRNPEDENKFLDQL